MLTSQAVVDGLIKRGVPRLAAVALAGNASVESGFDPAVNERAPLVKGSRGGFGLWQHTGPRRKALETYAGARRSDASDPEVQMDFIAWELANTEKKARDEIYAARTPSEAAKAVSDKFLRPGIPHLSSRIAATEKIAAGEVIDGSFQVADASGNFLADEPITTDQAAIERAYRAFIDGQMSDAQRQRYENDVRTGRMPIPTGMSLSEPAISEPADIGRLWDAYEGGRMSEAQSQRFLGDVRAGVVPLRPAGEMGGLRVENTEAGGNPANTSQPGLDIAASMAQPGLDMASAAFQSLTGGSPLGPQLIPSEVGIGDIQTPEWLKTAGGFAADAGLVLGGLGSAAYGFGAGGLGDLVESVTGDRKSGQRLSRDLMAAPEAFAGSPNALMRPRRLPSAPEAPPQAVQPSGKATKSPKRLASEASINLDELEASKRLEMQIPVDVFADGAEIKQVAGALRAITGSDDAVEWENVFKTAQRQASELIETEGGGPDIGATAARVQEDLTSSIDSLRNAGSKVYDEIKTQVPIDARARPDATTRELNRIITELGGTESLTGPVKRLLKAVTSDQGMTYARLQQERAQVGRAAFKNAGPYADADERTLKRLYAALGDDQRSFVVAEIGEDAAKRLDTANGLWTSAKDLEDKLADGFGKDQMGSIANKLRAAVTNASRGDAGNLNRILDVVPESLQRESLLTAISSLSEAQSGQGGFSFARFAKTYRGLRENTPIYQRIYGVLGPETDRMLTDLYAVAKRIDEASQNIPRTGKSNQPFLAEGLMQNVLNGTTGRYVRGTTAGAATSLVTGNPILGGAAAVAAQGGRIGKRRSEAVSALFRNPQFQELMVEASKGSVSQKAQNRVVNTRAYQRWAKESGISNPQEWLAAAVAAQTATQAIEVEDGATGR